MILNLGDFPTDATVYVPFHTFSSDDPSASITITGLAVTDIEIYKNGSATQRSSDSGYALLDTDGTDFDGTTGLHGFSIDLSDNTDSGFFAAGAEYWVAVAAVTVDGATINFWAAVFSIARTGGAATILTDTEAVLTDSEAVLVDTEAATAVLTDTEAILIDSEAVLADTEANAGVITDTEAILADSEAVLADTNELQVDWTNAGRLDAILDAVLADTEAAVPVLTDTEAILADTETGLTERATLLTDTEAILGDTEAAVPVLTDTEAVLADSEAVLADTETGVVGWGANVESAVNDASASTTSFVTDLTEATDDHYIGRIIIFTSGALTEQATDITDYNGTTKAVTVTALTEAPADNDTFVIV